MQRKQFWREIVKTKHVSVDRKARKVFAIHAKQEKNMTFAYAAQRTTDHKMFEYDQSIQCMRARRKKKGQELKVPKNKLYYFDFIFPFFSLFGHFSFACSFHTLSAQRSISVLNYLSLRLVSLCPYERETSVLFKRKFKLKKKKNNIHFSAILLRSTHLRMRWTPLKQM